MLTNIQALLAVLSFAFLLGSCEKPLEPIGYANHEILKIESNNWQSVDTIISVDPQTFVMDTAVIFNDLRPDTLAQGDIVFKVTEYSPIFDGCVASEDPAICTQEKLRDFVNKNLEYPRWAKVRGIQGTSIATFTIDANGRVRDTGVERSMGDEMDKLVLQLVEQLPIWYPAFHKGKPVALRYRLPVTFTLPLDE